MYLLLWLLVATIPFQGAVEDQVDLIEVTHAYDERGQHIWDQVIFYDWHAWEGRHRIRDYRLVREESALPVYDCQRQLYVVLWHDWHLLREVRSAQFRERWVFHRDDPELLERAIFPKESRRELTAGVKTLRKLSDIMSD